ncbi:MOSC domain-containing protein [Herbiconiux ginsengi]|uniref:MOSC domain-containing protein YiiM n=1 Tax=Herbiconiux ginsengi TaxID=381665 RepID=A0A1H3TQV8_9MICO|nr:MOSC domain-containing protein [Herbiconiux ginsengi]SDZ52035.1 MOSC domain-containing protein YiiM [Herbiconiux ginsengi]
MTGVDGVTELLVEYPVEIVHLLVSSVHRYEGRPADGPLPVPAGENESPSSVEVRAGLGIVGDRYFGRPAHKRAAVTVMAAESLDAVQAELGLAHPLDPAATRRNIVLRGVPVDALAGVTFSLDSGGGPVLFQGHRPANPCAWMNVTLADGAHKALHRRGGIRSEPLSDGVLRLGPATLRVAEEFSVAEPPRG